MQSQIKIFNCISQYSRLQILSSVLVTNHSLDRILSAALFLSLTTNMNNYRLHPVFVVVFVFCNS